MKLELKITGMSCHHCVGAVRQALGGVQGVVVEAVDVGSATIRTSADAQMEEVRLAIEKEGFQLAAVAV